MIVHVTFFTYIYCKHSIIGMDILMLDEREEGVEGVYMKGKWGR